MLPSVFNNSVGLSILIPVYNFNVTSLVQSLADQLQKSGKEGEIILLDDDSSSDSLYVNQSLQNIPSVKIYKNEKNEGRMLSRQKLSSLARFDHLLFLDCDSGIINEDFLSAYFDLINKDIPLASGGRVYSDTPPSDCLHMLHWKYGTKRESRNRKSGTAFQSNNFLIKKEIFDRLDNSFQLPGYGHEDSYWGIQFEQAGVPCYYSDNSVLHTDIEAADKYLEKSEQALSNLLVLEKEIDNKLLSKHVRIYRWYRRIKNTGLSGLYLFFEKMFHNYFRRNLLSCKPSLFYFDCYRLAGLLRIGKGK
jgi:glycosyltransferase involved in cell wall biosynthesis